MAGSFRLSAFSLTWRVPSFPSSDGPCNFRMRFSMVALLNLDGLRSAVLQGKIPCTKAVTRTTPCRTFSFVAIWFRQSHFILTQVQQTNDVDLTHFTTLQPKSVTCLQVGPGMAGGSNWRI